MINDMGQRYYAIGSEGSIARLKEMYPGFIRWAGLMYEEAIKGDDHYQMCFVRQIIDEFEHRRIPSEYRKSIWELTKFFTEMKIQYP